MNKPIGGRGKRAPYETTHVRIPVDLKAKVEELVEQYRNNSYTEEPKIEQALPTNTDSFIEKMLEQFESKNLFIIQQCYEISRDDLMNALQLNLEQTIELANKLLATRETKKQILSKLITAIYQIEVNL